MAKHITQSAPIKYCLGNDISKNEMSVCFSQMDSQQHVSIKGSRKFQNSPGGWKALQAWIGRFRKDLNIPLMMVVEATGVYYEGFAYYFRDQGFNLHVLLPNKSKHYVKSLNVKTKTDKVDAQLLAQIGLERNLPVWKGMSPLMMEIKQLSRQRTALIANRVMIANQLHAHTHSHFPQKIMISQMHQHLKFLEQQILKIETHLMKCYSKDAALKQKIDNICTIKGIGVITALIVVSETNAFDLIENKSQLVSYAGYDIVENQSGTSIKGKTRISKKGNSHIRRALHFPAISAAINEPEFQNLYDRIHQRNPKIKMIAFVAVQRKLLTLIYTLYKKNEPYNAEFFKQQLSNSQKSRQDVCLAYTA
jgi:transposase